MTFLKMSDILTDAQTLIQDNSNVLRAKMLTWANQILARLGNEFPWSCLLKTASVTITTNAFPVPADFVLLDKLTLLTYTLTVVDEVNERNAYLWQGGGTVPIGYYLEGTSCRIVPGTAATSGSLRYLAEVPKYTDAATDTLFTVTFSPIIMRALLDTYYEYESDNRAKLAVPLNQEMLDGLIAKELKNPDVARKYQIFLGRFQNARAGAQ